MARQPETRSGRPSEPRLSEVARHLIYPEAPLTGWPPVRDRCARMGLGFDRWQDGLGRVILAKRKDGLYAAGIDGVQVSIPRQTGKTYTIGAIVFALCTLEKNLFVLWTAHRTRMADETFRSMQGTARKSKVAPYVERVRQANGQQEITFKNGSRILFGAREGGFGRGFAGVDVIVFDEAQILGQKALDDMVPATNTARNPLILRLGTPPKPTDPSEAFSNFRREALAGDVKDGTYVELSADEDADPEDRAQWRKANPSYPHRTPEAAILRMKRALGPESFRREGLGIWDRDTTRLAIDAGDWVACEIPGTRAPSGATRWCAAVRFSVDGATAGLARAGRADAGIHTELVGVRPMGEGVQWIVDYLLEHRHRWAQVVVEGKSAAGDMVDRLHDAGMRGQVVWTPSAADAITAHAMTDAAIREHTMTHLSDPELAIEVGVARRRRIGTNGGFGWEAPEGHTVAGLDAITLALWATKTTKRRPKSDGGRSRGVVMTA